ncbi:dienelactone hydrolase [Paenibacillus sambharensis]|uniref:Dienelactone hydrolase n=1 Tax=Paenibacillus sambharensis TaxID=1803190 RepID=A0A2W1LP57_9BACL|nr:dienelactone hydrolase [Paenibacillus sambharensis]PZD96655.1 dienelactone hydrolase [Paenibacillus sambharensis]
MRLVELLLLLFNTGWLILSIVQNRKIPLAAASGIGVLLLAVHAFTEGFRVQMLLSYLVTVLFAAVTVYSFVTRGKIHKLPRYLKFIGRGAAAVMLLLTIGLIAAFPVFKLPEPAGEYHVGTQTFHFTDTNREELFDDKAEGYRELMVQVWYPAQDTHGSPVPFIADERLLMEEPLSKTLGFPSAAMDYLKYVPSHSYEGAEISAAQAAYPLILLNHGYKSSRIYHTSLAEHLASHGYIVASIDHTYSSFATVFPGGRVAAMRTDEYRIVETEYRDQVGAVWTGDVAFVLDQFEKINAGELASGLHGKLDMQHIGVIGHSFGGAAAYDASYDDRITAGINLDGGLYRYHGRDGFTKPFMFMFSENTFDRFNKVRQHYVYTDEELQEMGATREEIEQETRDAEVEISHFQNTARHGGYILYVEGMSHYNFADVQFLTPILQLIGMTGEINPATAASIVNSYTLDFFDRYLKDKDGDLLEGPSETFPEVKIATPLFDGE